MARLIFHTMEILVDFKNSRRVVAIPQGSCLEAELEKDIVKRFPSCDIAIAAIGTAVAQSSSKDVYILQRKTRDWGFVDITD